MIAGAKCSLRWHWNNEQDFVLGHLNVGTKIEFKGSQEDVGMVWDPQGSVTVSQLMWLSQGEASAAVGWCQVRVRMQCSAVQ